MINMQVLFVSIFFSIQVPVHSSPRPRCAACCKSIFSDVATHITGEGIFFFFFLTVCKRKHLLNNIPFNYNNVLEQVGMERHCSASIFFMRFRRDQKRWFSLEFFTNFRFRGIVRNCLLNVFVFWEIIVKKCQELSRSGKTQFTMDSAELSVISLAQNSIC